MPEFRNLYMNYLRWREMRLPTNRSEEDTKRFITLIQAYYNYVVPEPGFPRYAAGLPIPSPNFMDIAITWDHYLVKTYVWLGIIGSGFIGPSNYYARCQGYDPDTEWPHWEYDYYKKFPKWTGVHKYFYRWVWNPNTWQTNIPVWSDTENVILVEVDGIYEDVAITFCARDLPLQNYPVCPLLSMVFTEPV